MARSSSNASARPGTPNHAASPVSHRETSAPAATAAAATVNAWLQRSGVLGPAGDLDDEWARHGPNTRVAAMPFEIPENLHPNCGPVAWLLGTWRGNGHGDYPTIEAFQFGQELIFSPRRPPVLPLLGRAWIVDEEGEFVRDAAMETGFLRCPEAGKVELLLAHNTGFAEIWYGEARRPASSRCTPTPWPAPRPPRRSRRASGSTATSRATCSTPTTWPRWARSSSRTPGRGSSAREPG